MRIQYLENYIRIPALSTGLRGHRLKAAEQLAPVKGKGLTLAPSRSIPATKSWSNHALQFELKGTEA